MYAEHVPQIAKYATQSPQGLFRVGLFVQMTINQHIEHVPLMVKRFDTEGLTKTGFMGWQQRAVSTLANEQDRLFAQYAQWRKHGKNAAFYAIKDLVELPGFGIIKSAFIAQMLLPGVNVGCLDRHNLRLHGLDERAFSRVPSTAEGLAAKIKTYLGLCRELGGSEKLWNSWCCHVAQLRPYAFPHGEEVSQLHVDCIVR